MRTNLAWRNLVHETTRTAVAAAGVAFAVVLIFMQLGFFRSLERSATLLYDALEFDLCIRSKDYLRVSEPRSFPRQRLYQALSDRQVIGAQAFHVGVALWRNPQTGEQMGILVLGAPNGDVFGPEDLRQTFTERVTAADHVLIDRLTRREFGPLNGSTFGDEDVAARVETQISEQPVELVGHYTMGAGFAANGSVLISERGFQKVMPGRTSQDVTFGLLSLSSGAEPEAVAAELTRTLPNDVEVLTREQLLRQEREQWVTKTSYGLIFQIGITVALIVGTAIVYQVLSSDVSNLLPEYATLKAMGYGNVFLAGVVLQQALALSLLGYLPGYACSHVLYIITAASTRIPIYMTWYDALLVLLLAVVMCGISGIGAASRVFRADPASLF